MKKFISVLLSTLLSLMLISCSTANKSVNSNDDKSVATNTTNTNEVKNKSETTAKFNVDWEKCINDTKAEFVNSDQYKYVKDIYIEVEKDKITFTAVISDSSDGKTAISFADSIIRRFNANAQLQDSSIKSSSKDYLGGIYDSYSISIGIAPLGKSDNQKEWYIQDVIGKEVHRAPKLKK